MMNRNYKICFVCTGNACRSPFAECVLQSLLRNEGLIEVEVFSRGTIDWGENSRDETMVQVAKEMGYELTGTTTPMTYEVLKDADMIIAFDTSHRNSLTRVLDYCNWNRIILFNKISFDTDTDVMDPHGQTIAFYHNTAAHIVKGCMKIVEKLKESQAKQKC